MRRVPKSGRKVVRVQVVELLASGYSVPLGTVGIVSDDLGNDMYAIDWTVGRESLPIHRRDLGFLGEVNVEIKGKDQT